jgi:hypothetical protein
MPSARSLPRFLAFAILVAHVAFAYSGKAPVFSASLPLGTEAIVLQPSRSVVFVMASAQSPAFAGLRLVTDERKVRFQDADGQALRGFPPHVDFRITASMRARHVLGYEPFPITTDSAADTYLRGLTFRLKVFRWLEMRVLKPLSARMIGVPADVPFDERTYRVSFELPDVSIEDRIVLEVLAPDGQRLARFHLPLN